MQYDIPYAFTPKWHDCWEHFGIGIINVISWNKNVFNVELFPNFPYMYLVLPYNAMKENANGKKNKGINCQLVMCSIENVDYTVHHELNAYLLNFHYSGYVFIIH